MYDNVQCSNKLDKCGSSNSCVSFEKQGYLRNTSELNCKVII